jgi:hypothetical protein
MMLVGGLAIIGYVFKHDFETFDHNNASFKAFVDSDKDLLDKLGEIAVIIQNTKRNEENYFLFEFKVY